MNEIDSSEYENVLQSCSGIVFTGGADVHPELYGKPERIDDCTTEVERDTNETLLAELASKMNLPILWELNTQWQHQAAPALFI